MGSISRALPKFLMVPTWFQDGELIVRKTFSSSAVAFFFFLFFPLILVPFILLIIKRLSSGYIKMNKKLITDHVF